MSTHSQFGKWLQARRRSLQLTQDEFAWQVGCTTSMLQKIEASQRKPSRQMAQAIARALSITPQQYPSFIEFARGLASANKLFCPPNNLLTLPTRLIGREQELRTLVKLITRDEARLITLTGSPGVGKTHLAQTIAVELRDYFMDGVYFVSLASIIQAELVLPLIMHTLGLEEANHKVPLDQLIIFLSDKCELIILDSFEHVTAAAKPVARLSAACPYLKIVVTSRVPLRVQSERQFPIKPLRLPELSDQAAIEELRECPSVKLFIDRAQAFEPCFQLNPGNAESIIQICRHLEGLPLAIELIAARLSSLAPQEILTRLKGQFLLNSAGAQDADQRHGSLKTAIDWSFNLLSPTEQDLFVRAGVFTGNWSLAAFTNLVGDKNGGPDHCQLDNLSILINHNLIQHHEYLGYSYYSMLEPVREYAIQRLAERFEPDQIRRSHANYYVSLLESAELPLRSENMQRWLSMLEHEQGNLTSALSWSLNTDSALDLQLRLAYSLHWFWLRRETVREGREWLERVLAKMEGANHQDETTRYLMAKVLLAAGRVSWVLGDYKHAYNSIERSILIFREMNEGWILCLALHSLSIVAIDQGHYERVLRLAEECMQMADIIGDAWLQAQPRALLGELARIQGEDLRASIWFQESLNLMRQSGDIRNVGFLLLSAAQLANISGDYTHARALLVESLEIHSQYNTRRGLARGLEKLAEIEVACMNLIQAARLLGAAEKLRLAIASPVEGTDLADYNLVVDSLRAGLDEQTYNSARLEGSLMPLDEMILNELIEDALAQAQEIPTAPGR